VSLAFGADRILGTRSGFLVHAESGDWSGVYFDCAAAEHVLMAGAGDTDTGFVDRLLAASGRTRRIAVTVKKTLESAIANAENNHSLDVDRLVVAKAEVGRSAVMKRFMARGRGKAARVEKWFSHLKIVVAEVQQAPTEAQEAA
jgi:hypothetical protein